MEIDFFDTMRRCLILSYLSEHTLMRYCKKCILSFIFDHPTQLTMCCCTAAVCIVTRRSRYHLFTSDGTAGIPSMHYNLSELATCSMQ
jgi:hypothetical protein